MDLNYKVKDAYLKPDGILNSIGERFNFKLSIPNHSFGEDYQETSVKMIFNNSSVEAICTLTSVEDEFNGPSYFYEYSGPILDRFKQLENVYYHAFVLENFGGCRGGSQKIIVIRDFEGIPTTPNWFPCED